MFCWRILQQVLNRFVAESAKMQFFDLLSFFGFHEQIAKSPLYCSKSVQSGIWNPFCESDQFFVADREKSFKTQFSLLMQIIDLIPDCIRRFRLLNKLLNSRKLSVKNNPEQLFYQLWTSFRLEF